MKKNKVEQVYYIPANIQKMLNERFMVFNRISSLGGIGVLFEHGRVIVIPPTSRDLPAWVARMYRCRNFYDTTFALLPAFTEREWFHSYVYHKAHILFIKGRLKYFNSAGKKYDAPFPSMLVWWRRDNQKDKISDGIEQLELDFNLE